MTSIKVVCDAGAWLGQPTAAIQLTKFGWLEKRALLSKSTVSGEDVHNGPCSRWFDLRCPTIVGSVGGKIYKVAVTVTALTISPYELVPKVIEVVSTALGTNPRGLPGDLMVWDGDDGNVVVQPIPNSVPSKVAIFLTLNIVRPYVQR